MVAALTVGVFVSGLPSEFARLQAPCDSATSCAWLPRLTGATAQQLGELGLPTGLFAAYFIAIEVVFTAMSFALGSLIFWRRPEDRMALVVSLTLITFGATFFCPLSPLLDLPLLWKLSAETISFVGSALLILFSLLPDGVTRAPLDALSGGGVHRGTRADQLFLRFGNFRVRKFHS